MMNDIKNRNLTMLTDFYELTMAGGYFENGFKDKIAYFDMFYRRNPDNFGRITDEALAYFIKTRENLVPYYCFVRNHLMA